MFIGLTKQIIPKIEKNSDRTVAFECQNTVLQLQGKNRMDDFIHYTRPRKGPFWLIDGVGCDDNGFVAEKLVAYPVDPSQTTPSHKDIWDSCGRGIKKPWNYYPRGRVEIRKDKAIVFANSRCFDYSDLSEALRSAFCLGSLPMELKADNSVHYAEGIFGEYGCEKLKRQKETLKNRR